MEEQEPSERRRDRPPTRFQIVFTLVAALALIGTALFVVAMLSRVGVQSY